MFKRFLMIMLILLLGLPSLAVQGQGRDSSTPVVIIVVDDFSGEELTAEDTTDLGEDEACVLNVEGQGFRTRGLSVDNLEDPHGTMVLTQIEDTLATLGAGDNISLVQVDIGGLTTDVIADELATAVDEVPDGSLIVINMSFAIIPCDVVFEIQATLGIATTTFAATGGDVEGFVNDFDSFYQSNVVDTLAERFTAEEKDGESAIELDPLFVLLSELSEQGVVLVAAAGNFGLDVPFYPAAWDGVISVSGSNGEGMMEMTAWDENNDAPLLSIRTGPRTTQRISHYGEIMMKGEIEYNGVGVIGTSFAAPRLTAIIAVYLSSVGGTRNCANTLAYGDYENLTLPEAVSQYCPTMSGFLPK